MTVIDALTYAGRRESLADVEDAIRLVEGDICDSELVSALVAESDAVVHFAAESHVDNALDNPEPFLHTNVVGTFTILEAVRRHGVRLHHISTDEVYGDLELGDPQRFTESTPYNPSSPYSATKAGSDMLVRAWVRSYGVQATTVQLLQQLRALSAHREIHSAPDHQRAHRAPAQAVRQRPQCSRLDPRRRPQQRRATNPGEGADRQDLPDQFRGRARQPDRAAHGAAVDGPRPDDFDHVTDRVGHDLRYAIDPSLLYNELCWAPKHTDFEEGLHATIDWYRANESWWRPLKDAAEARYEERGQ